MKSAGDKAQEAIRKTAIFAKTVVDRAGTFVSNGFWKARKAAQHAGEKVKVVGQKIEEGA